MAARVTEQPRLRELYPAGSLACPPSVTRKRTGIDICIKTNFDTIPESQNVDGKINTGAATCCSLPKFRVKGDCPSVNEISEKNWLSVGNNTYLEFKNWVFLRIVNNLLF
jgi:hypothetical protein